MLKKFFLSSVLLIISNLYSYEPIPFKSIEYGNTYINELVSVYDGDTFKVNIFGYPPIVGNKIGIRVNGIDTPEIRSKDPKVKEKALEAKEFTFNALSNAKVIELKNIKRGKYFRILADVFFDGKNLAEELIKAGLALPYDGGTRPNWEEHLNKSIYNYCAN